MLIFIGTLIFFYFSYFNISFIKNLTLLIILSFLIGLSCSRKNTLALNWVLSFTIVYFFIILLNTKWPIILFKKMVPKKKHIYYGIYEFFYLLSIGLL